MKKLKNLIMLLIFTLEIANREFEIELESQ